MHSSLLILFIRFVLDFFYGQNIYKTRYRYIFLIKGIGLLVYSCMHKHLITCISLLLVFAGHGIVTCLDQYMVSQN
jgi:hypothetical protein